MNLPHNFEGLLLLSEMRAPQLALEAELFLVTFVTPVVRVVGFDFGARYANRNRVDILPYLDVYAEHHGHVPDVAAHCYAWSIEHLADGCQLVSVFRREQTVAPRARCLGERFSLAALILGRL